LPTLLQNEKKNSIIIKRGSEDCTTNVRIITSTCIRRLFFSGHAKGMIEKMRSGIFSKVKK
jgi:hypothetical protein